jgi:hypothetical protein
MPQAQAERIVAAMLAGSRMANTEPSKTDSHPRSDVLITLHHWHSTVRAGDLLHRLTPLSGHTPYRRFTCASPSRGFHSP